MVRIEIDIQDDKDGIGVNVVDYRLDGNGDDKPTKTEDIIAKDLISKIEKELESTYGIPYKESDGEAN